MKSLFAGALQTSGLRTLMKKAKPVEVEYLHRACRPSLRDCIPRRRVQVSVVEGAPQARLQGLADLFRVLAAEAVHDPRAPDGVRNRDDSSRLVSSAPWRQSVSDNERRAGMHRRRTNK